MSSLSADARRAIVVLLAGVMAAAALWVVVIAPKRSDKADAQGRAEAQQARLDTAEQKVSENRSAKADYPRHKRELRKLDVAVPARGAISELLRELQAEARRRGAELQVVALKDQAAAATALPATPGAAPAPGPTTPGAAPGPDGLSTLPFSLNFTGRYFDLVHLLRTVRRAVSEQDGKVVAKGRLLTIDGLTFQRPKRSSSITKASMNATAYIAPPSVTTPAPGDK